MKRRFVLGLATALLISNCAALTGKGDPDSAAGVDGEEEDEDTVGTERREETPEAMDDTAVSSVRTEAEIKADAEARRTFPLVYNEMVQNWIDYFTSTRGRPVMEKWLGRSTRYIPLMQQVLRDEGLPEDLIYLSMIESGFNLKARSHAKAVGPWQFIPGTGKRYDLEITYWLDERSDIRKSTIAAAQYLKELHQIFGSWYLAAASYNAGEGRTLMAVRTARSRNFWELARNKKNFRAETRNYVPKIIAAALISKNPAKFGFTSPAYQNPMAWEIARIPNGVTLKSVASLLSIEEEELDLMNTELRRGITPPGENGWDLRVPVGKRDELLANVAKLESKKIGNFIEHTIRRGENLSTIARKYGVGQSDVKDLNKIRNVRSLRPGRMLLIPVSERYVRSSEKSSDRVASPKKAKATETSKIEKLETFSPATASDEYRVQSGDSLWTIAQRFNTSVNELKRLNGLRSRNIRAGITLKVPAGSGGGEKTPAGADAKTNAPAEGQAR